MRAFLCTHRPRSVNAKYTSRYQEHIRTAHAKYCSSSRVIAEPLYGITYYLHKKPTQLDADNLSKPIWDALEGVVYDDDLVVQLRHSGVIDLGKADLTVLDLSRIPDSVANDIIAFAGTEDHIIYVEFGLLQPEMFVFGQTI